MFDYESIFVCSIEVDLSYVIRTSLITFFYDYKLWGTVVYIPTSLLCDKVTIAMVTRLPLLC